MLFEINLVPERRVDESRRSSRRLCRETGWGPVSSEAIDHRYRIQLPYCVSGTRVSLLKDRKGERESGFLRDRSR